MRCAIDQEHEWLEADGLGGFASGTTSGIRTRRYHAVLLAASRPPTGRYVLVNGFEVFVRTPVGHFVLTPQRYAGDVVTGSRDVLESFESEPWPRWEYKLPDGTRIVHELFVRHGSPSTVAAWRLVDHRPGISLQVRPLMSGRDYHALHHENSSFRFEAHEHGNAVRWMPYPDVPGVIAQHNGRYHHDPVWYRRFEYEQERARGFDNIEDLASPGILEFDLNAGQAAIVLSAETAEEDRSPFGDPLAAPLGSLRCAEAHRREQFGNSLDRAADAYIARRDVGLTIIAGYPWFADWGRDTFISLRGLCLATGRVADAGSILTRWASVISEGMMPNRFPDSEGPPEYNSVDASLWFIIAAHEFIEAAMTSGGPFSLQTKKLRAAIQQIVAAYAEGTRYGIGMTSDGLLAAGEPGMQLTWMDARIGDRVVTPRIGKPVEVQALWINSLWIASQYAPEWKPFLRRALATFEDRFWNDKEHCLYDVIDCDHADGTTDASIRPNQILAIGGLPLCLLDSERARQVVDHVEARLLTPLGLRSLASDDPAFCPMYAGAPETRDSAYHQGTVWPWLLGPFVEAWLRVREDRPGLRSDARSRFLVPVLRHLEVAGLGHISEVADGQSPHRPGGCPFQAWSIAELLRLDRIVLQEPALKAAGAIAGTLPPPIEVHA